MNVSEEITDDPGGSVSYGYSYVTQSGKTLDRTTVTACGAATTVLSDMRGNRISIQDPDAGTVTSEYDALNRITGTTDANGNRTDYEYDIIGRVTRKVLSNGNLSDAVEYTYGNADSLYYVLADHLGSWEKVMDDDKNTVQQAHFDPWGNRMGYTAWDTPQTQVSFPFSRGFTGHEHYDRFKIVNANARLYDPTIGRFFSPDPYVQVPDFTQAYNRYSYCMNNPVMYKDEDGEFWHIIAGAIIGGVANLYSNWNNIDNFWEGLSSFAIGAGSGALIAVNPLLGSVVGSAVTEAHNEITSSTGQGTGFSQVDWANVVGQSIAGAVTGFLSYGAGSIIGQTGVATKLMNAIGLKNLPVRNIIGSTINGTLSGTVIGFGTGLYKNDGNLWQYTWRGAAFGGVGGLAYGLLTEAGYQIQLKIGRNKYLDSDIIDGISNVGDNGINQLNNYEGGEVYGQYALPEITVVAESATTATVYTRVSPNSPYIPPAPYKYYSPTLYKLLPLLIL